MTKATKEERFVLASVPKNTPLWWERQVDREDMITGAWAGAGAGAGAAVIKSTGYMSTRTVKDNDQTENKLVFVFNSFSKCIIHSLRHGLVLG